MPVRLHRKLKSYNNLSLIYPIRQAAKALGLHPNTTGSSPVLDTMRNKIKKAAYQKEYHKKWYAKPDNKLKKKQQAKISNDKTFLRNKEFVDSYKKEHPCLCGESDIACLEFHHIDASTKEYDISDMVAQCFSLEKIKIEIIKCEIKCANCHKKFHYYNH